MKKNRRRFLQNSYRPSSTENRANDDKSSWLATLFTEFVLFWFEV